MKKIYFLICCAAVCLCTACDDGKIKVKGADGTVYESYQEACTAEDFQAAHDFLDKMQNNDMFKDVGAKWKAEVYVYEHELLFLMSQGNETAKKRIIYLLKEIKRESESYCDECVSMLVDLAIEDDDEAFVKQLANQYTHTPFENDHLMKIGYYLVSKEEKVDENKTFWVSLVKRMGNDYLLEDSPFDKKE